MLVKGSLEVKFRTMWTDGKAQVRESEKRKGKERRSEERNRQKKEDPGA